MRRRPSGRRRTRNGWTSHALDDRQATHFTQSDHTVASLNPAAQELIIVSAGSASDARECAGSAERRSTAT
ncbi:Protein of unknown function [Micromonospora lupini str. Lupac 08]|uniref:Uncharacterized protein n=1 Tax=Micromonospora lupini str. Lupac 08 TaxID=1150864 RepID=I0KW52_9ACTN|nr:Protein of unknown function [Micromonospora lupini str. Lupac 08]